MRQQQQHNLVWMNAAIVLLMAAMIAAFALLAAGCASGRPPGDTPTVDERIAAARLELQRWQAKLDEAEAVIFTLPPNDPVRRLWEKRASRAMGEIDWINAYVRLLLILADTSTPLTSSTQPASAAIVDGEAADADPR